MALTDHNIFARWLTRNEFYADPNADLQCLVIPVKPDLSVVMIVEMLERRCYDSKTSTVLVHLACGFLQRTADLSPKDFHLHFQVHHNFFCNKTGSSTKIKWNFYDASRGLLSLTIHHRFVFSLGARRASFHVLVPTKLPWSNNTTINDRRSGTWFIYKSRTKAQGQKLLSVNDSMQSS